MKNPGEIYRDDPFFPPDQDLSAVAFQRIAPYSEAFWHFYWNKDERKVRKYTLPPIVSQTAEEWEKKERPATLRLFKDFMYGIMPPGPDRLGTGTAFAERGCARQYRRPERDPVPLRHE